MRVTGRQCAAWYQAVFTLIVKDEVVPVKGKGLMFLF